MSQQAAAGQCRSEASQRSCTDKELQPPTCIDSRIRGLSIKAALELKTTLQMNLLTSRISQ